MVRPIALLGIASLMLGCAVEPASSETAATSELSAYDDELSGSNGPLIGAHDDDEAADTRSEDSPSSGPYGGNFDIDQLAEAYELGYVPKRDADDRDPDPTPWHGHLLSIPTPHDPYGNEL